MNSTIRPSGWVEHDPTDIWETVVRVGRAVIDKAGIGSSDIAAIGITNQRETTLVWDRATGEPIHKAIVWQDRRTAGFLCLRCEAAAMKPWSPSARGCCSTLTFRARNFAMSSTTCPARCRGPRRANCSLETVDTFLIWKMTGGAAHVTDATNACRTLMYNLDGGHWDEDVCRLLGVPVGMLPEVKDCAADFGTTSADLFGAAIPILGVAGDQQAATVGQACFAPGMLKSTYGTGLLRAFEHRRSTGQIAKQASVHGRLPVGWQAHLCARRVDLYCRRSGSMAA